MTGVTRACALDVAAAAAPFVYINPFPCLFLHPFDIQLSSTHPTIPTILTHTYHVIP
jgi:hypothetical protein